MAASTGNQNPWYLRYTTPILFPSHDGLDLSLPQSSFDALVRNIVLGSSDPKDDSDGSSTVPGATMAQKNLLAMSQSTRIADTRTDGFTGKFLNESISPSGKSGEGRERNHPFIQGLLSRDSELGNQMQTANGDMAYRSTKSALVDLFYELEDAVSGSRLDQLLTTAWAEEALATLKIIFNARSIHLGKSSQTMFYRCAGWLAQRHPLTLIANLRWLSRPIIQKKVEKKDEGTLDTVIVDEEPEKEKDVGDVARFDVKHGASHGYWKDLLNILVLGVKGSLVVTLNPRDALYVKRQRLTGKLAYVDKEAAKALRHETRDKRHDEAISKFNSDPVYRGLYLAVARLFAEQLKADIDLLKNGDHQAKKNISLCAKWAPSHDRFHDKHTFIVSSIAEMLYPMSEITSGLSEKEGAMDRELYLRHARERYRKDMAALRAHLDVVERKMTAKEYGDIKYDRVPSVAMSNYAKIFAEKDSERFEAYMDGVAEGRLNISGATLLPSKLMRAEIEAVTDEYNRANLVTGGNLLFEIERKVREGQWKSLVQRIKDSGTLESSIAVCDVSGSMFEPVFADGTRPIDSAVGLSLILAEVTEPPFGGHFITFSTKPKVHSIPVDAPLAQKVREVLAAEWHGTTNFTAVFETLILPMAIRHKLTQAQMVKRVFVFSDMHFDQVRDYAYRYGGPSLNFDASSFERIRKKYADAGYEMPELVFWNLAGGWRGPAAPKPVTADEVGTALVSGYSQAMLKVFLDNGSFDVAESDADNHTDAELIEKEDEDGNVVVEVVQQQAKRQKIDPLSTVRKAISHKAYEPLQVMD